MSGRSSSPRRPEPAGSPGPLEQSLRRSDVEVDFSTRRRAEYSADASNYRHVPVGVAFPRAAHEVGYLVAACRRHGVPLTPRGGGTSVAGNAIGEGLVLDCSRHFGAVVAIDPRARTAVVEPGVVLNTLQSAAAPSGLRFGPDPSTASRCTIGGMIGNNACGARSLEWGTTADNVIALDLLLPDGTRTTARRGTSGNAELDARLRDLVARHEDVIRAELGRFPRQVSGYGLQYLLPEHGFDVARALVGSEGTLAILLGATLRLVPVPAARCLVAAAYPDMVAAAFDVPAALEHNPSALEGLGAQLVETWSQRRRVPVPDILPSGGGWLFAEVSGATSEEVAERAEGLAASLSGALATRVVTSAADQALLWRIREDGAGLGTRSPDGAEAWPGFEDSAVPAERLGPYLRDLTDLLERYGRQGTVFGHFGEGCLHVRIDHDLQSAAGREEFIAFTREAAVLVASHGGSVSGEHGDGQARSALLDTMYSPALLQAFAELKAVFDPEGMLNPGVLVNPASFSADLRAPSVEQTTRPSLELLADGGDFGRAARRCVGVGKCRAGGGGVMCPSYRATRDEKDSTRGRARVLQEMLDGRLVTDGYRSTEVLESLDLCLGCKGCKTDCPVGVDMATYKSEFLYQHYKRRVRPVAHYSLGWLPLWARFAGVAPRLANAVVSGPLGPMVKRLGGIAAERSLPTFATRPFSRDVSASKTARRSAAWSPNTENAGQPTVVLWADTFTEHFTPEVGHALLAVLRSAGFRVVLPPRRGCCGLTWISTGQLDVARRVLRRTLEAMRPALEAGLTIIVPEPSCAAAFRHEAMELLPDEPLAALAATQITGPSEFLVHHAPDWRPADTPHAGRKALIQVHCHQYASGATGAAERELLARAGVDATVLDAGCCGLAGDFGVVKGHYEVSMAVGETGVLPAVRALGEEELVVADGFSCRTQIQEGVPGRRVLHVMEVLAAGL